MSKFLMSTMAVALAALCAAPADAARFSFSVDGGSGVIVSGELEVNGTSGGLADIVGFSATPGPQGGNLPSGGYGLSDLGFANFQLDAQGDIDFLQLSAAFAQGQDEFCMILAIDSPDTFFCHTSAGPETPGIAGGQTRFRTAYSINNGLATRDDLLDGAIVFSTLADAPAAAPAGGAWVLLIPAAALALRRARA